MTHDDDRRKVLDPVEARQGVTGHNVRFVLGVGLVLAALAGVLLYFTVGT